MSNAEIMNGVVDKLMAKPLTTLRAYLTQINKFHVSSISFATINKNCGTCFLSAEIFLLIFLALFFF